MSALRNGEPDLQRDSADALRSHRTHPTDTGSGIVLALGGGFSRGFAHLGVLDVLEQEGLPVSAIVGTSVGGLLGAAYADGIAISKLCDLGGKVRLRDFLRFQHSSHDAQAPRKDCIGRLVQEQFHVSTVEDLPIPTAIVCTDIDTAAPHVITRGPLDVALRASCAFPGLVKPVAFEGRLLADGCISAPVPTAIAARMHPGCVLGVNVASSDANSFSPESMVKVFDPSYRASHRSALEPSWARSADILLEPQVHHIDWNDFSRVNEAFAAGAEAMRRALPYLREILGRRAQLAAAHGERREMNREWIHESERGLAL